MTCSLRDYQQRLIGGVRAAFHNGAQSVLGVLPTGAGKSVIIGHVAAGAAARARRVVVVGHRAEIVEQLSRHLRLSGVEHGLLTGATKSVESQVTVASIGTLARRLDRLVDVDLLVVDEAHHAIARSWRTVIQAAPRAHLLGFTATPMRLDGAGLGDLFDRMVLGPSVAELIRAGYLAPFRVLTAAAGPNLRGVRVRRGDFETGALARAMGGAVISSAVDGYVEHCPGARAIAFAVDCEHSRAVVAAFLERGIPAAHVDSATPPSERRRLVAALSSGEIKVLSNVDLFGEGVDLPAIETAILLRPTMSLGLYLQQVGRALRLAYGKSVAVILDYAGNAIRHGLPDEPRHWTLEGNKDWPRDDRPQVRICRVCKAANCRSALFCDACGAGFRIPIMRRDVRAELVDATDLGRLKAMRYDDLLAWAGADEARLHLAADVRGYKPGWIRHRLRDLRAGA